MRLSTIHRLRCVRFLVSPLLPFSVCFGWTVFLFAFLFWLLFSRSFGFCLILCGYCSAVVLLELLGEFLAGF
jgi:hypothetical protein